LLAFDRLQRRFPKAPAPGSSRTSSSQIYISPFQSIHSKESKLYKREEELKKKLIDFKNEFEPQPYERKKEIVSFVKDSYKQINSSKNLADLKIDPRKVSDHPNPRVITKRVII